MRKMMIWVLLIGLLIIGCKANKEIEIKENYVINNTLFLHVEATGNDQKDFEEALEYIKDNKIKSSDIVVRLYDESGFRSQREYEMKDNKLKQINSMGVRK